MFAPVFDHSFNDLFNQYVNVDSSTSGDGNKDVVSFGGDLDQFFPVGSLPSDCGDLSPGGARQLLQSPPQPWRGDLWCLQQDAASHSPLHRASTFHESIQPSEISDLGLSLEDSSPPDPLGLLSTSPSTPPATPNRKASAKSAIITPKSIRRREPSDRRALLRKHSFSPSVMRSAHMQTTKMAYPEAWTHRLQSYNNLRGGEDRLPLSPPPSDILVQHEHMRRDSGVHLNAGSDGMIRDTAELSSQYGANMLRQTLPGKQRQQAYVNHHGSAGLATASPPSQDDLFHSPPSSESQQMSTWHPDAMGSGLSFTPDMNGHDGQSWWSPSVPARVSQAPNQHSYMVSPLPQKHPMQNVAHNSDLLQGGLMIQFDPSFDMGSGGETTFTSAPSLHSTSAPHIPTTQHPSAFSRTPFMTAGNIQQIGQSRSPSMSPTNTTSPKSRVGKNMHRRTHSRKLSSNSATAPKPATKQGSSPKGAGKSANVSFVNFTAHDSKKILTGVAPSGSSKTKARREQEAREKRRKLSEAALLAVRQAGGDVEALEAVFC